MMSAGRQPQQSTGNDFDVKRLLSQLCDEEIDFIVTGSVAVLAYGIRLTPANLDIIPAPHTQNVHRLAQALYPLNGGASKKVPPVEKFDTGDRISTTAGRIKLHHCSGEMYAGLARRAIWAEAWDRRFRLVHPDHLLRLWQETDRPADWPKMEKLAAVRADLPQLTQAWPAENFLTVALHVGVTQAGSKPRRRR